MTKIISNKFPAAIVAGEQITVFTPPDQKTITINFHTNAPSLAPLNLILLNGLSELKGYGRSFCVEITTTGVTVKNTTGENVRLIHLSPQNITEEDEVTPIMQGGTEKIDGLKPFKVGFFTYQDDHLAYVEISLIPPTPGSRTVSMAYRIVTG